LQRDDQRAVAHGAGGKRGERRIDSPAVLVIERKGEGAEVVGTMLALAAALDLPSAGEVRALGQSLSRLDEAGLAAYRARQRAVTTA